MKKYIVKRVVALAVVVAAMGLLVARRGAQVRQAAPYVPRPVVVDVARATRQPLEATQSYLGIVEAAERATLASRISSRIVAVARDEGDWVKEGELLLQLDDGDLRAQILAAEASIQSLATNQSYWMDMERRDNQLAEEGVVTSVEAETTRNRRAEAEARLVAAERQRDVLQTQLAYVQLASPFDGQISRRAVDPGDLAMPGMALMTV
jgi:RND family efflux transporter MFP subunit